MLSRDLLRDFFRLCLASPLINLVECLALGWPFYNFKSSKPNKPDSSFRKKVLVIFRALIKALCLAQWLDPLLASLFLKISLLAAKASLLALPLLSVITPPPCHVLPLPVLLRRSFMLSPQWLNTWRMTSSGSLGPFSILDLLLLLWLLQQLLSNTKNLVKGL